MRADLIARQPHHERALRTFAAGLARHGIAWNITPSIEGEADFAVCWGWKAGKRARDAGRRVLVLELGYVGERAEWTSVAWDGLNGRGRAPGALDGGERWERLFARHMRPWRAFTGDACLIIGQVAGDASLLGVDIGAWYAEAAERSRCYGYPLLFRRHPLSDDPPPAGVQEIGGSLARAFNESALVVTFNSNAGVDATLAGLPVVACDRGSMVWSLAGRGLGSVPPFQPHRGAWAADLAWRQWSDAEIARGDAWEFMRREYRPRTGAQDERGGDGQG